METDNVSSREKHHQHHPARRLVNSPCDFRLNHKEEKNTKQVLQITQRGKAYIRKLNRVSGRATAIHNDVQQAVVRSNAQQSKRSNPKCHKRHEMGTVYESN